MERLVTSSGYEGVLSPRGIKPELVGKLGKCGHMYHLLCLLAMYNNGNKVSCSGGAACGSGWVLGGAGWVLEWVSGVLGRCRSGCWVLGGCRRVPGGHWVGENFWGMLGCAGVFQVGAGWMLSWWGGSRWVLGGSGECWVGGGESRWALGRSRWVLEGSGGCWVGVGEWWGDPGGCWVGAGWVPPLRPTRCPQDGSLQCPTCKAIYGEKTGTQPPGKMEFHLIPHSLPGYTDSKTIRIVYDIPTGIQVRG